MAKFRRFAFVSTLAPCLAAGLSAQANLNQSRGVLAGAPTAVLVDGGIVAGTDAQTRAHRNGFSGAPTAALPNGSFPPDLQQIFQYHQAPAGIDIDDFSMGRDVVLVVGDGYLQVPPSSWGVLSFSLRQGAVGNITSTQPRIAQEAALGSIGAAMFSWVLPGSNLPPEVVGRVERSHSRQDLGVPVGSEVDGIDVPLMLGRDQVSLVQIEPGFGPLVSPDAIYFTVSSATAPLVPNAWWGSSPALTRSGATILMVDRSSINGPWSQPRVYCAWYELGLLQNEDIDGLAVDAAADKIVFSLVGLARDQFLFADCSTDGIPPAPSVVKSPNGTPISQQVGKAQGDDVDAVCTLDPTIGSTGGPPPAGDDFGSSCGAPGTGLLGVPSVHASAFRRRAGAQTLFDTWMVGWPPVTGVTAGFAIPFVTLGNDPTLFQLAPLQFRNPADPIPGNPRTASLLVPPALSLTGFQVTFRWAAIDANVTELAEAWPVRVFL